MSKKYTVLQDGLKECGSACLLSIIRYYGGDIPMAKLLELTKTNKDGTNFYNLKNAANELGMSAKGYELKETGQLLEIDKPFISQLVIKNYLHFVVVYKMKDNKVTIMDPAKGMVKLSLQEFTIRWTGYILVLEPYKPLPIYKSNNYLNKVIINIISNNKKMLTNIIILSLISTIFTCLYSYHLKVILDNVLNTDKHNLIVISIIFIQILLVKIITTFLRNYLLIYFNQKLDLSIMTKTISKIISLPFSYYKNKTTGETISRINDLMHIKNVIAKMLTTFILDIFLSIIVLIILLTIDKSLTSLLIIITIYYLLIFLIYLNSIKNTTEAIQENSAKVNSLLVESISSYETIKGLNMENYFKNKINKQYLNLLNNNLYLSKIIYSSNLIKDIFEGIIIIIIIYLGVEKVMDKSISLGSLITYNTFMYYYLNGIKNTLDFYREFYYTKNSLKRINNLLDYQFDNLEEVKNLDTSGGIYLNNLSFSYTYNKPILKGITLDIPPKTKLLVLGKSGSGKSTLLKILYKYYQVKRDQVFISNYDINDFSVSDIRKNITYISQNEFLYTDTIRNNIIMERDITETKFLEVCKLTYVSDIIKDNILSYNFILEENGANISGGQRQRIILARALLKPSNIILIDEGLNEIDISLERKILKNIFAYCSEKLIIIISHRLDNIDLYDKVIKIDEGILKEGFNKYV